MGEIFFNLDFMFKYYLGILISLLFFNQSLAKNINIQENINLTFKCELEKKIIKNSEYNYKTFLAEELNDKNLDSFKIYSNKPNTLLINGLSKFFSQNSNMEVKIVNKDVVLFKAFNNEKTYSESAIITRKSGELIHEVTRNINSENSEKDISIYYCKNKSKNA